MFTTGHLSSGIAVGFALGLDGAPLVALLVGAVLTDWDYSIQIATGVNHRERLTHAPVVVALVLALAGLVAPILWWVLVGSLLHFAMDLFDYGLRVNPFSKRIHGLKLLDCAPDAPFSTYIRTYFTDRRFLALEAAWLVAAVVAFAWR